MCLMALAAAGCCPTTAGPTAPATSHSVVLEPGQSAWYDADTPPGTTQVNLTFRISAIEAPIQLRQIDPGCEPTAANPCASFYDSTLTARPPGVMQFGNTLQPYGTRTRIVLRNPSETALSVVLTIEPRRAGCT